MTFRVRCGRVTIKRDAAPNLTVFPSRPPDSRPEMARLVDRQEWPNSGFVIVWWDEQGRHRMAYRTTRLLTDATLSTQVKTWIDSALLKEQIAEEKPWCR